MEHHDRDARPERACGREGRIPARERSAAEPDQAGAGGSLRDLPYDAAAGIGALRRGRRGAPDGEDGGRNQASLRAMMPLSVSRLNTRSASTSRKGEMLTMDFRSQLPFTRLTRKTSSGVSDSPVSSSSG